MDLSSGQWHVTESYVMHTEWTFTPYVHFLLPGSWDADEKGKGKAITLDTEMEFSFSGRYSCSTSPRKVGYISTLTQQRNFYLYI